MKKNKLVLCGLLAVLTLACLTGVQAQTRTIIPIGDVNRSGTRDIVDALLVAQYSAGLAGQISLFRNVADVNLDKAINIVDAMQIAQAGAGLLAGLPAEEPYKNLQSQLTAAYRLWQLQGLNSYIMELKRLCFCPDANNTYRLVVEAGKKTAVTNLTDNSEVPASGWDGYPSVEELFTLAQAAIDRKYVISTMTFHPTYVYPQVLSMDPDLDMLDEQISYQVISYRPANVVPPIAWTSQTAEELSFQMSVSSIWEAYVHGDLLTLYLRYDGGCYQHKITVLASDAIVAGQPSEVTIYVQNDGSQPDYCMAIVPVTVTLDLSPIKQVVGGECKLIIPTDGYHVNRGALTVLYK